jgi:hypothetical protein
MKKCKDFCVYSNDFLQPQPRLCVICDNPEIEFTEEQGNMVKLLRWVLKHYSTGTDIDGFFMWENPLGEEFSSMRVVEHYLKENK